MSVLVDTVDITPYVRGIKPGRGFAQSSSKHDLALKPGSYVYSKMAPGTSFSLSGRLFAGSMAALRTLIGNMHLWLRPRNEDYRIDYNGSIFYARILSFTVAETNLFDTTPEWEAQFISEGPVPTGVASTLTLVQDTIVGFMNTGPGVTMPVLYKVTAASPITFEMSDIEGAGVAYLGATEYGSVPIINYGTTTSEYEYKLTDAVRCVKWTSGTGHSGAEGGVYWQPSATNLSAENCYTIWVAILVDKNLISSARISLGDGTNYGWVTVTDRISDGIWSWVPVFVREAKKANASLNTAAITRVRVVVTPNTDASIDFYVDGHLVVRNPAKLTLAATSYSGLFDTHTGKFRDIATGQEVNPAWTIQGHPWVRPGCNLFYQNSVASDQYAYVRSAV